MTYSVVVKEQARNFGVEQKKREGGAASLINLGVVSADDSEHAAYRLRSSLRIHPLHALSSSWSSSSSRLIFASSSRNNFSLRAHYEVGESWVAQCLSFGACPELTINIVP